MLKLRLPGLPIALSAADSRVLHLATGVVLWVLVRHRIIIPRHATAKSIRRRAVAQLRPHSLDNSTYWSYDHWGYFGISDTSWEKRECRWATPTAHCILTARILHLNVFDQVWSSLGRRKAVGWVSVAIREAYT